MKLATLFHNGLFAFTILCECPLSYLIRRYVTPKKRPYFHIFFGFLICSYLYGLKFLLVLASYLVTYAMLFLPGSYCLLSLIIPFVSLGIIHAYKYMHVGEWGSDISGLIMFNALRFWTIAFNLADGRKKEIKRKQWKDIAISRPPSFLLYIAYLFSYNGLYSGPVIPITTFDEIMQMSNDEASAKSDFKDSSIIWLQSFIMCLTYGIGIRIIPAEFIISEKFISLPYIIKLFIGCLECFLHISRYMFAWLGGEAGFRALGAEHVKTVDFENCRSIRLSVFFRLRSISELSREWNHTVHFVLKEFIHVRLLTAGFPYVVARAATFLFSAYWHGFLPGYYILAFEEMIFGYFDDLRRKWFDKVLEKYIGEKYVYYFDIAWTHMLNFFMGAPFDLYWAEPYFRFYKIMKFGPYIVLAIMILIGYIFKPKQNVVKQTKVN
ncbi:MBOAT family protein [Histomonas meleagridis]|uniref:MBOAT family protein n=1 Tax=Histomonas meleagridis TaxID=135588 RepID=UPI00355AA495|nr:MBOAT family protein [Histomonas meleagridis]KAH0799004.1 MBOAT family protein [Histomonas meleagridis]